MIQAMFALGIVTLVQGTFLDLTLTYILHKLFDKINQVGQRQILDT